MTQQTKAAQAQSLDDLPDHSGVKRRWPVDFFAPAPPEIGKLISADSDLRQGKKPIGLVARLLIAVVFAAVVLAIFLACSSAAADRDSRSLIQDFGFICAPIAFVLVLYYSKKKRFCTYVGEQGAARFLYQSGGAPPTPEILIFEPATELHAASTRHYYNGIYTGTSYTYYWNDADGKVLARFKGRHRGNKKNPKQGDPYHFVRAAEFAWSRFYLARAQNHLETEGSIPFRVDKKRWVRVGQGFMEFHFGGEPVRVNKEEIDKVTLGSGKFSFKRKDAKWFSSDGKFAFQYGTMANAQVFLMALDKLMGWRWT
jgi:hypothetical protein